MVEIWKDLIGYKGLYQISTKGRVKSLSRVCNTKKMKDGKYSKAIRNEKILKGYKNTNGYMKVNLTKDNKLKGYSIHRLVALTFILNIENKPQVNHIDGNKENNFVNNLEWVTNNENQQHAIDIGLKSYPVYMFDKKCILLKKFNSVKDAYDYLGRNNKGEISKVIDKKNSKEIFCGYRWSKELSCKKVQN